MIKYGPEETQYLIDNRYVKSSKELAVAVSLIYGTHRTYPSINQKLARLGLSKPHIGTYTEGEIAMIKLSLKNMDMKIDQLIVNLTNKFGARHSAVSIANKRSKLNPVQVNLQGPDTIAIPDIIVTGVRPKADRACISTLQLAHAMTVAGHSIKSLALKAGLPQRLVNDMLIRTGVGRQYMPRIRAALAGRQL